MLRIALVSPYEHSIPVQVTAYRAFMPRYGLLTVADAMLRAGHHVQVYCELCGSKVDWDYVFSADVVCISCLTYCAPKAYQYIDRIRAHSSAPIIMGGCHASSLPEDCLEHCDYVVRNEGEKTIVELLEALEGSGDPSAVRGVSFCNAAGAIVHNPDNEFIDVLDYLADPSVVSGFTARSRGFYLRDGLLNGIPRFNIAVIQTSRGCPFDCAFCFVKQELGKKYRKREPELVLREIERSVEVLKTRFVFFVDNEFTLDRDHALAVLSLLEQRFHGDLDLFFFARIFIAQDHELMQAIERAGRACIGVGIESLNPRTLELFHKPQSVEDIHQCLGLLTRYRVATQLLFIFGSDTDTIEHTRQARDLVISHRAYNWGFASIYDLPGREKALGLPQFLPDERFIHRDWRFYSGNFVVHYPLHIRPSVLQREMSLAYREFYRANREALYQYHPIQATFRKYIPILESAEQGLYDSSDNLISERLPGPLAGQRRLGIEPGSVSVVGEVARFYWNNLTRPVAWRYLWALVRSWGRG
ncbi:MAG: radical SAM protein [Candidatus Alcyoniella australis]|nr:radical SAM protein [Candidatus Alcyoniella australis]